MKTSSRAYVLLRKWYGTLNLSRHESASWYQERIREELQECRDATTTLEKLSETSDVYFSTLRAQFEGCSIPPEQQLPDFKIASRHTFIYAYMLAKFTLRWQFYRTAAFLCKPSFASPASSPPPGHGSLVCEVVNPKKDHKLDEVASRHGLDQVKFKRVARRLRWFFPLLP